MKLLKALPRILEDSLKEYEELKAGAFENTGSFGVAEEQLSTAGCENILGVGDNLEFMKMLRDNKHMQGKITLIYVDPPFFTKAKYEATAKLSDGTTVNVPAYCDKWENNAESYYQMLCTRLYAMKDLLAEDGGIWLHLDWHAVHYAKILMDEIFGEENFINEVIWTYKSGGSTKKRFARKHDTLLYYGKSKKYFFYPQKEKSYNRGLKPYKFKGVEEFKDEIGWYTMVNMKDVWSIDMVGRTSSERTGYATQKPEALMKRIIESCSRPGDICADFFGGSGSFVAAAARAGRKWIYCDGGKMAAAICMKRMSAIESFFEVYSENNKETYAQCSGIRLTESEEGKFAADFSDIVLDTDGEKRATYLFSWSIDTDYDGMKHVPSVIHYVDDEPENFMQEFDAKNKEKIHIEVIDVFGNIYTPDEL